MFNKQRRKHTTKNAPAKVCLRELFEHTPRSLRLVTLRLVCSTQCWSSRRILPPHEYPNEISHHVFSPSSSSARFGAWTTTGARRSHHHHHHHHHHRGCSTLSWCPHRPLLLRGIRSFYTFSMMNFPFFLKIVCPFRFGFAKETHAKTVRIPHPPWCARTGPAMSRYLRELASSGSSSSRRRYTAEENPRRRARNIFFSRTPHGKAFIPSA